MSRTPYVIAASLAGMFALSSPAFAQSVAGAKPHTIVVKLVSKGGNIPFAFEPSTVVAQRGDTVRFLEDAGVTHNVHFKDHPRDSKLGSITTGPYLTTKGQTYDVIVDKRFTDGTYTFVCDPHELLGMHGTLVVSGNAR